MAITLTGELKKEYERIAKTGLREARAQYNEAEKYWLTSTAEEDKARRAFVTVYEEPIDQLYALRDRLSDAEKTQLDTFLDEHGYTDMLNDYKWKKADNKYDEEKQVSFRADENDVALRNSDSQRLGDRTKAIGAAASKEEVEFRSKYVGPTALDDPTLTAEQRKGLKDFHQWLYRNCDKHQGYFVLGSEGGVRAFAEEFMKKPASVQLKALYLIETKNRKQPDNPFFDFESQTSYVPNIDNLKDKIIANKLHFWKKLSGDYLYWNKLKESLAKAEANKDELENFRAEQNQLLEDAEKKKDKAAVKECRDLFEARAAKKFLGQAAGIGDVEKKMDDVQKNKDEKSLDALKNELKNLRTAEKPKRVKDKRTITDIIKETSAGIGEHVGNVQDVDEKIDVAGQFVQEGAGINSDDHQHYIAAFTDFVSDNQNVIDGVATGCKGVLDSLGAVSAVTGAIGNAFKIKAAAGKHSITTTADRVSTGATVATGVLGSLNSLVKTGFKGAKYIAGNTDAISKASDLFPYISAGIGTLGIASNFVGKQAAKKRMQNFEKVLTNKELKDDRAKQLAALGYRLSYLDKEKSSTNAWIGGATTTLGVLGMVSSAVPFLTPVVAAGGIGYGIAKSAINKQYYEKNKSRLIVDSELLGGDKGMKDKKTALTTKLKERLKRYKEGSEQHKKIQDMIDDESQMEDRIREDHVVKDGSLHIEDNSKKQMKKIVKEIFSEIYYVNPKDRKELITKDNYDQHYNEKTNEDEYRKRTSYQDLFRGFKVRGKKLEKMTKQDVQKLENKIMKNM